MKLQYHFLCTLAVPPKKKTIPISSPSRLKVSFENLKGMLERQLEKSIWDPTMTYCTEDTEDTDELPLGMAQAHIMAVSPHLTSCSDKYSVFYFHAVSDCADGESIRPTESYNAEYVVYIACWRTHSPTPCCPSITNLGRGRPPCSYNSGKRNFLSFFLKKIFHYTWLLPSSP